jgi:hypothetical protein
MWRFDVRGIPLARTHSLPEQELRTVSATNLQVRPNWSSSLPIKTSPVLDEHIIYAAAMIALAAAGTGNTRGVGRCWNELLEAAPAPLRAALA